MENDKQKIDVVFRKWKNGNIIALFPYEIESGYNIMSYEHIGQHGSADYNHVVSKTKKASEDEYKPLLDELTRIGYEVRVIQRMDHRTYRKAFVDYQERVKRRSTTPL